MRPFWPKLPSLRRIVKVDDIKRECLRVQWKMCIDKKYLRSHLFSKKYVAIQLASAWLINYQSNANKLKVSPLYQSSSFQLHNWVHYISRSYIFLLQNKSSKRFLLFFSNSFLVCKIEEVTEETCADRHSTFAKSWMG